MTGSTSSCEDVMLVILMSVSSRPGGVSKWAALGVEVIVMRKWLLQYLLPFRLKWEDPLQLLVRLLVRVTVPTLWFNGAHETRFDVHSGDVLQRSRL
jgi:hypothetical protein